MKLITRYELTTYSTSELHGLHRDIFNALACSAPHSAEQRCCLTSLKNLEDELASRMLMP